MISGDHIETCKRVALACGIITEDEQDSGAVVMTGEDFLKAVGEYESILNEQTGEYDIVFSNPELFNAVRKKVRIIARASSEDKFVLVAGTK